MMMLHPLLLHFLLPPPPLFPTLSSFNWNGIVLPTLRLDLPTLIYQSILKTLQETCFHMIQNPVKVPFKINHHKHITYLGVSKTPNLSLVLFLQLRMRLNKENN